MRNKGIAAADSFSQGLLMIGSPAALQVVADLLIAAGCDGATPIAVPAHHYEEQEHVRGSNLPLAAALSKCYDLRSVDAVRGNEHGRLGQQTSKKARCIGEMHI